MLYVLPSGARAAIGFNDALDASHLSCTRSFIHKYLFTLRIGVAQKLARFISAFGALRAGAIVSTCSGAFCVLGFFACLFLCLQLHLALLQFLVGASGRGLCAGSNRRCRSYRSAARRRSRCCRRFGGRRLSALPTRLLQNVFLRDVWRGCEIAENLASVLVYPLPLGLSGKRPGTRPSQHYKMGHFHGHECSRAACGRAVGWRRYNRFFGAFTCAFLEKR